MSPAIQSSPSHTAILYLSGIQMFKKGELVSFRDETPYAGAPAPISGVSLGVYIREGPFVNGNGFGSFSLIWCLRRKNRVYIESCAVERATHRKG